MKKVYKNILIVRTDRIGDVVLTTPAIGALREGFPDARISILVSPLTETLVLGNPNLNHVFVDDRLGEHQGFSGFLKLVKQLKWESFDLAVIFHTKKRSNLLCYFAGIPQRIGYKNEKFGWMLTDPLNDTRHLGAKHETEYCLDVVRHLGVEIKNPSMFIPTQADAQQWAQQFILKNGGNREQSWVAIHPGASDPSRRWPEEYFAEVVNVLMKHYGAKIVFIGNAELKPVVERIRLLIKDPVIDLTNEISLLQLSSLLRRCRLLISNDSGPAHIAAAVGSAVISIFTRNQPGINVERWRPLGPLARSISVPRDQTQTYLKAGPGDVAYLQSIKPETVLQEVDAIFKLC
jgi:heptosyltransferase-2